MRKISKPKRKYQKGGEQRAKNKLPSAPAEYREMAHQIGYDTTGMTRSPVAQDIAAKKHLINTDYQGADKFYKKMPVQDFVKHIGDPMEGPSRHGYDPMRRSTMDYLYNLPPNFESMQEAQDSLQQYRRPKPEFQYGGGYETHPRLAAPQMPNMPDTDQSGNVLGGAASGAAMGAKLGTIVPGVGNVIGAGVGGVLGVAGGLLKNRSARKEEEQMMEQYRGQVNKFQTALLGQNSNQQLNTPTFKRGGQMEGGLEDELQAGFPNAEVEGQEIVQSPMGEMASMLGPSHEEGGIDVSMDPGDRVYSDELKDDDGKTFAEKAGKFKKSNEKYQKILDDPRATKLAKFTANKMIQKLSGQLDQLFQKQEAMKGPKDQPQQGFEQFGKGGEKWEFDLSNRIGASDSNYGKDPLDINATDLIGNNIFGDAGYKLPHDPYTWDNPNKSIAAKGPIDQGYSWGNLLGDAATYGPAAYNLFKGAVGKTPDIQFDPNQYSGYQEVTPRRVSLDPIRRDIEGRERASNRAIGQMGADTTGATYARMAANAADTKRAMASTAMTEEQAYSQADLQAQMANQQAALNANQLGLRGAMTYEDMRQKARAVPTAHLTAGLTQLSDIAQSRRLMENQRARDVQREHALEGYSNMFGYDEEGMGFGTKTSGLNKRRRGSGWLGKSIRGNKGK